MTSAGTFRLKSLDSCFARIGYFDESEEDGKRCAGVRERHAFSESVSESCQLRQASSGKYELKFPPFRNTKETMAGKAWISLKIPMLTTIQGGMNIA